jgi:FKBP-type peptidyl-prolyl cis-trans isomerase
LSRNIILAAVMLAVPIVSLAQDKSPMLDSNLQKFSYAMGYRMARDLLKQGVVEVDAQALTTGVEAAMAGDSFRFTPDEIRTAMIEYQKELVNRKAKEALSNEDTGKAFLLANAQKDGVKKLPDGIQYTVLVEGKGEQPGLSDTIKVHYVGTLLSGTEFDSSRGRGDPAQFKLNQVIPGWQTALAQMPIGSRWKVWIPADQGYGLRGSGAKIGPSETLVFDIELLDIVEKGEAESSVKEPADEATKEPAEAAKK